MAEKLTRSTWLTHQLARLHPLIRLFWQLIGAFWLTCSSWRGLLGIGLGLVAWGIVQQTIRWSRPLIRIGTLYALYILVVRLIADLAMQISLPQTAINALTNAGQCWTLFLLTDLLWPREQLITVLAWFRGPPTTIPVVRRAHIADSIFWTVRLLETLPQLHRTLKLAPNWPQVALWRRPIKWLSENSLGLLTALVLETKRVSTAWDNRQLNAFDLPGEVISQTALQPPSYAFWLPMSASLILASGLSLLLWMI